MLGRIQGRVKPKRYPIGRGPRKAPAGSRLERKGECGGAPEKRRRPKPAGRLSKVGRGADVAAVAGGRVGGTAPIPARPRTPRSATHRPASFLHLKRTRPDSIENLKPSLCSRAFLRGHRRTPAFRTTVPRAAARGPPPTPAATEWDRHVALALRAGQAPTAPPLLPEIRRTPRLSAGAPDWLFFNDGSESLSELYQRMERAKKVDIARTRGRSTLLGLPLTQIRLNELKRGVPTCIYRRTRLNIKPRGFGVYKPVVFINECPRVNSDK